MFPVLLILLFMWIYATATTVMVLKGDFSYQQKENTFVGYIVSTAICFLVIGRNW
jgi:hypothetical protein